MLIHLKSPGMEIPKDLAEIMLMEDSTLVHKDSGKLPKGKWYTKVVKKLFHGDINSFVRAREMYKVAMSNNLSIAFIYRRPDLSKTKISYKKGFDDLIGWIHQLLRATANPTDADIQSLSDHVTATAEGYEKKGQTELSKALLAIMQIMKDQKVIQEIVTLLQNKYDEETINNFFQNGMNQKIEDLAEQAFFKNNDIQGLRTRNVIYHPGFYHKWISNLAWLIANLKLGKKFLVISDIAEDSNKFRANTSHRKEHSAFAREVCAVIKAGYELKREGSEISLTPSETFDPSKCTTNGLDGDGINPSKDEVENIYSKIQKELLSTKGDFTLQLAIGTESLLSLRRLSGRQEQGEFKRDELVLQEKLSPLPTMLSQFNDQLLHPEQQASQHTMSQQPQQSANLPSQIINKLEARSEKKYMPSSNDIFEYIKNSREDSMQLASAVWRAIKIIKDISSQEAQNYDEGFRNVIESKIREMNVMSAGNIASSLSDSDHWNALIAACIEHARSLNTSGPPLRRNSF